MAPPTPRPKSEYEKWQDTINSALTDRTWDAYDGDISRIVEEYNRHLAPWKGFTRLDWRLVKAMVWTETGGPSNPSWRTRPMQIGNPRDPGLRALFADAKVADLIIPPTYRKTLTAASAVATPQANIQAGVGYLFMRHAKFGNIIVAEGPITDFVVRPGDSFARIAGEFGSITDWLQRLNPGVVTMYPKQHIKFQKAELVRVITGLTPITMATIADRYNAGDSKYATKLKYCLEVMAKVKEGSK